MRLCTVPPSSALAALAFALFLLNSCVAARRVLSRDDAWVAAFVVAATVLVTALLGTVHAHERAREERRRGMYKAAVWAQSETLTAVFAHRVVAALSQQAAPAMAYMVWTMAGTTMAGGFYCIFLHGRDPRQA